MLDHALSAAFIPGIAPIVKSPGETAHVAIRANEASGAASHFVHDA